MQHDFTVYNILELMHNIPMATPAQLKYFFSGEIADLDMDVLLNELCSDQRLHRHVQYKKHDVISEYDFFSMGEKEVSDFLDGFWVLARYGSANIKWVVSSTGVGPTKYIYELPTGEVHDLAVIKTSEDARLAYIRRNEEDKDSRIHHQALLIASANEATTEAMKNYGFEGYFRLNQDHVVSYYRLD